MTTIHKEFWCPRVRTCFDTFVKKPSSLTHLLLFGPPGSGKTTSAHWLVNEIWKNQKSLMCISMNAADERSLEAIRQKIFPFLRASWDMVSVQTESKPRFIILDECETLTEAAQLSLQTILNKNPQEVCIILICNSQSRIHPKLRQRLLCIRYDPPSTRLDTRDAFHEITRGDLRLTLKKQDIDERLWFYIHAHPDELLDFLRTTTTDSMTILTELLLLMNLLYILDTDILELINQIFPLSQANVQMDRVLHLVMKVIRMWQLKFEASLCL